MQELKSLQVIFSKEQIAERIAELGAEISKVYEGQDLVVICVLKGGFMFFADLVRHITVKPELDFVRLASYGNSSESSRAVSFTKDVEISLKDKHVLIVEDIVDTGHSMKFLMEQLAARGAASLRLAVLVSKTERREVAVKSDFVGFSLSSGFIVGYGLDYAEKYRELDGIYEGAF